MGWSATTPMGRVILEALSAGALDVEVFTIRESTPRSPTSLTGWRLTPLLCQLNPLLRLCLLPPCHPQPCHLPLCHLLPCPLPPCLQQPCQQPPCLLPLCHPPPCHQLSPPQPCLVLPCNDFC